MAIRPRVPSSGTPMVCRRGLRRSSRRGTHLVTIPKILIQTLHDCISFRASAGARALAVRQADCVCPESFPRRTAAVGSAEVLAQESIRSQFKKFRFKHHMTASLPERPPGRVHWQQLHKLCLKQCKQMQTQLFSKVLRLPFLKGELSDKDVSRLIQLQHQGG